MVNAGCKWGTYGYNCNETCQAVCENNVTCSATTGICLQVNQYINILKGQLSLNYFLLKKNYLWKTYVNVFIASFRHAIDLEKWLNYIALVPFKSHASWQNVWASFYAVLLASYYKCTIKIYHWGSQKDSSSPRAGRFPEANQKKVQINIITHGVSNKL